jgi:hypothetical protein
MKMTESDYLTHAAAYWSNAIALTALFVSILSGYVISAYVAGANMSRAQLVIINTLYLGVCALLLFSMLVTGEMAVEMERIAFEMTTDRKYSPGGTFPYLLWGFWPFCVFLSIKFMWDIRSSGTK